MCLFSLLLRFFPSSLLFSNHNVSLHGFLWVYPILDSFSFFVVWVYLSSHLGYIQPLFFQTPLQPHSFSSPMGHRWHKGWIFCYCPIGPSALLINCFSVYFLSVFRVLPRMDVCCGRTPLVSFPRWAFFSGWKISAEWRCWVLPLCTYWQWSFWLKPLADPAVVSWSCHQTPIRSSGWLVIH